MLVAVAPGLQRVVRVRHPQRVVAQPGHLVELPAPRVVGPQPVEGLVVGLHAEPVDAGQPDRRAGAVDDLVAAGVQVAGAGAGGGGGAGVLTAAATSTPAAAVTSAVSAPPRACGGTCELHFGCPASVRAATPAAAVRTSRSRGGTRTARGGAMSRGRGHSLMLTGDPRRRMSAVGALAPVARPGSAAHSDQPASMRQPLGHRVPPAACPCDAPTCRSWSPAVRAHDDPGSRMILTVRAASRTREPPVPTGPGAHGRRRLSRPARRAGGTAAWRRAPARPP